MIGVDTNILVYAHRRDSPFHREAAAALNELTASRADWAVPWHCLHEFYSIVTHPHIYEPASTPAQAVQQIKIWMKSPSLRLLAEADGYFDTLTTLLEVGEVRGPRVHDAHIAGLCITHGVRELLTLDRDFARFPSLRTRSLLA